MSRIGKKPVAVPSGVDVTISGQQISVKGKHGELSWLVPGKIRVEHDSEKKEIVITRPDDHRDSRALHGTSRALINNMVTGVSTPFERKLEIVGVGYNATLNGNKLALRVGYANTVELDVPSGVICEIPDQTHVVVRSADKQAVGQFAAEIRAVRPPEPYKGKGIRYDGEHVRRKAGKAFGAK